MPSIKMRPDIFEAEYKAAVKSVAEKLKEKIKEKGDGAFGSRHEILGVLLEEFDEFREAVRLRGNSKDVLDQLEAELKDIAVAAIWEIASIQTRKVDW